MAYRAGSSRDLPGCAVPGILDRNPHRRELVADAIGLLEVLSRARCRTIGDQGIDALGIDPARLPLASLPLRRALGQEAQQLERAGKLLAASLVAGGRASQ